MVVIIVAVMVLQYMIYHRPRPPQWMWAIAAPAGLGVIYLQWKTMQTVSTSMEGAAYPRPVEMALKQAGWPAVIRPLVTLWWLGQGALFLFAAHVMSSDYGAVNPTPGQRAFESTLAAMVIFMGAYASTCSLLFAIAALRPNRSLIMLVWRLRIVIDLCIAFAGTYLVRGRI